MDSGVYFGRPADRSAGSSLGITEVVAWTMPTRFAARLILSASAVVVGVIVGAGSRRSLFLSPSWPVPAGHHQFISLLCVLAAGLTVLASVRIGRFQLGDLRARTGSGAETQRRRSLLVPAGANCCGDYGADGSRGLRGESGHGGDPGQAGATGDAADYGWYSDAGDGSPDNGYRRPDSPHARPVTGSSDPLARQSGYTDEGTSDTDQGTSDTDQGNGDDPQRSGVDCGAAGDVGDDAAKRLYGQITIYTLLEDGIADFDRLVTRVVEQVRANEPGTLVYVAHVVPSAPLQRIIYGVYRDQAAYDEHTKQSHIREFEASRRPLMLTTNVIELGVLQAKVLPFGPVPLQPSVAQPNGNAAAGQDES